MRTVRDNYYIITGHTYEEYLKKFGKSIGKGKLLQFNENEVKYLKKNKRYWEVIGPDDKTLYCQISRFKARYVIIPLVVAVLAGGGAVAGIYLPKLFGGFNGKVTEAEWKEAFECLTHINKNNTLNYHADAVTLEVWESSDEAAHFKSIEGFTVDGDYENVVYKEYPSTQSIDLNLAKYKDLVFKKIHGDPTPFMFFYHDYLYDPLVFSYNKFDKYTYEGSSKSYVLELKKGENSYFDVFQATIQFNSDKKVKSLFFNYGAKCTGRNFNGTLNFDYGTFTVDHWLPDSAKMETLYNNATLDLTKFTAGVLSLTTTNELNKESSLINLDLGGKQGIPDNLQYIEILDSDSNPVANAIKSIEIYKKKDGNYQYLPFGEWGWETNNEGKAIGVKLKEPLKTTDQIKFVVSLNKLDNYRLAIKKPKTN